MNHSRDTHTPLSRTRKTRHRRNQKHRQRGASATRNVTSRGRRLTLAGRSSRSSSTRSKSGSQRYVRAREITTAKKHSVVHRRQKKKTRGTARSGRKEEATAENGLRPRRRPRWRRAKKPRGSTQTRTHAFGLPTGRRTNGAATRSARAGSERGRGLPRGTPLWRRGKPVVVTARHKATFLT